MGENMYSAEEAAQILGLQVRTVRNYVRDGRLPGVRIGKQYRISRVDLEAFTAGATARLAVPGDQFGVERPRATEVTIEVSCVVQVDGIGEVGSDRLQRTLAAAALATLAEGTQLRVEPLYDAERRRLKLIIVGSAGEAVELLRVVQLFAAERD